MYESNFNRIEQKYLMNKSQYINFFEQIRKHIEKDKFCAANICNIYFDNENKDMIINSLEKPLFKQKVRLRSYNVPKITDDVFLEVKTKYKKIVTKRRIKVNLQDFNHYLKTNEFADQDQIMKEIDYLFHLYNLKPVYFLAYDRKSFHGIENTDLRITVDEKLRSRKNNLNLNEGDQGKYYFKDDTYIMEIKYKDALPLWLVKSLSDLKIYPTSFSKIGSVYTKDMEGYLC